MLGHVKFPLHLALTQKFEAGEEQHMHANERTGKSDRGQKIRTFLGAALGQNIKRVPLPVEGFHGRCQDAWPS
jgi:hypothetical protein